MVKLETVARLMGREVKVSEGRDPHYGIALRFRDCPAYDTDANASRELLAYVKAKGNWWRFIDKLDDIAGGPETDPYPLAWCILNATPQQIYAAFCATFARELAELEKQP